MFHRPGMEKRNAVGAQLHRLAVYAVIGAKLGKSRYAHDTNQAAWEIWPFHVFAHAQRTIKNEP